MKVAAENQITVTLYFQRGNVGFHCGLFMESAFSGHYRKNSLKYSTLTELLCLQPEKVVGNYVARLFHSLFFRKRQLKFLSAANIMSTLSRRSLIENIEILGLLMYP